MPKKTTDTAQPRKVVKVADRYDPEERKKMKEQALQTARTERKLRIFDYMERAVRYNNEAMSYGLSRISVNFGMSEDGFGRDAKEYFTVTFEYVDLEHSLHVDTEEWEFTNVGDRITELEAGLQKEKDREQLKTKVLRNMSDEEREAIGFGHWQER